MNKIGLYLYEDSCLELYFDVDTLKFKATYSCYESPHFEKAEEALTYCKKLADLDVQYYEENNSLYKRFNKSKVRVATKLEELEKEMWSVDYYFAKWALPRVLYFKNFCSEFSTPGDFVVLDKNHNELYVEDDEWEQVLTDIVTALRLIIDDCSTIEQNTSSKIDKGLALFAVYIRALWT